MAASRSTLLVAGAMAVIAAAALLPATASAKSFRVGDDAGWDVGVDYKAWARGKHFKANDTLEFRYHEGQDVVHVDEQSFHNCVTPDDARLLGTGIAVDVVVSTAGKYFYICHAKGACESGMKLTVNVH